MKNDVKRANEQVNRERREVKVGVYVISGVEEEQQFGGEDLFGIEQGNLDC